MVAAGGLVVEIVEFALLLIAIRDVVNDRVQHRVPAHRGGPGVHVDFANLAIGQAMPEGELQTVTLPRPVHLGLNVLGGSCVDLADQHVPQLLAAVAVELGGGLIGIDDAAIGRVDDQLDGRVDLEDLTVIALPLGQGRFGRDAGADVAQESDELHLSVRGIRAVDAQLNGQLAAVLATGHHIPARADDVALAGLPVALQIPIMKRSICCGHQF